MRQFTGFFAVFLGFAATAVFADIPGRGLKCADDYYFAEISLSNGKYLWNSNVNQVAGSYINDLELDMVTSTCALVNANVRVCHFETLDNPNSGRFSIDQTEHVSSVGGNTVSTYSLKLHDSVANTDLEFPPCRVLE